MTLIVSLLTHDLALQVSDRRYSYVGPDGKVVKREDDHNKAVLLCGRIAIGFTGLGELNGMHTRRLDPYRTSGCALHYNLLRRVGSSEANN